MKTLKDPRLDPNWYYEHRNELDTQAAEQIRSGKAKPLTKQMIEARLKASKQTKPVTLRLATGDIELAKSQAEKKGLGYQTYLKLLIHQALTR